jgi:hypothetical protein
MQTISIDENSRILLEDNNYTLQYKRKDSKAKGGKIWAVGGYFPTLATLLQDWVINAPAHTDTPLRTLQELVIYIQKAEKHIENLIKGKQ